MYAKEMKGNISAISGAGEFLSPSIYSTKTSKDEGHTFDQTEGQYQPPQPQRENTFNISYGNYGDPYSFFPYQLILLLVDFVFNWTMDLVHEHPLAVLVIFVFQSLAIVINIVLYIMASASQAMQVGLQKRVNIHHWLNLGICLLYMTLTSWWFIWALRKSWPSVSDQFSFTWRSGDDLIKSNGSLNGTNSNYNNLGMRGNSSSSQQQLSSADPHQEMKEHFTLWSSGFNALYVIQRTVGIIYYFIYLRATFLVLNTTKIDKFLEMKRELQRKLMEGNAAAAASRNNGRKMRRKNKAVSKASNLGLDEYLSRNEILLEPEELIADRRSKSKKKTASVLWADDQIKNTAVPAEGDNESTEPVKDDHDVPTRENKKKHKGKRAKKREDIIMEDDDDDNDDGIIVNRSVNHEESEDYYEEPSSRRGTTKMREDDDDEIEEDYEAPPRPKPRPRSSHHSQDGKGHSSSSRKRRDRKYSKDELEDDD